MKDKILNNVLLIKGQFHKRFYLISQHKALLIFDLCDTHESKQMCYQDSVAYAVSRYNEIIMI